MSQLHNWEVFAKDPRATTIPNDGVAEVGMPETQEEWGVLRYELSTFVCEGEYHRGLTRILDTYLANLDKETQPAVWVSGFYGSGKSHLVRVLEHLWKDVQFQDGASARGITTLPDDVKTPLRELSTAGKRHGGLWAAAGTLGAGAGDSVRLAILGIVLKSAGLPASYEHGRFVLFLKQNGMYDAVKAQVEIAGKDFRSELRHLYMSPVLVESLLKAAPSLAGSDAELRAMLRSQYSKVQDISEDDMLAVMTDVLVLQSSDRNKLPCTLLVLDELQQYLGDNSDRTLRVQGVVQACSKRFGSKLLVIATGQSALQATTQLQKLQGRFTVRIELSDTDVEKVLRQVVLRKAPAKVSELDSVLMATSGEIDRQLQGTKIAAKAADKQVLSADYPLLPARRRYWERTLRAVDKAGSAGQLRTQLRIVHEASKHVAEAPLGTVVPGDFVYGQLSSDMLQAGVLLREIDQTIRELDDGSDEGKLRSRLCALIFLIGQLPADPVADIGVRPTVSTLSDLMVSDLKAGGADLRQRAPAALASLVDEGKLLLIHGDAGDEYRLQTRESAEWEQAYRTAFASALADDGAMADSRSRELRQAVTETLKNLPVTQGDSKTARKPVLEFGLSQPRVEADIPVWVRDAWSVSEKTVRDDTQAAGTDDATVFVLVPKRHADDLKRALSGYAAATAVLDAKGAYLPTTAEGLEAKKGMVTRQETHRQTIDRLIDELVGNARVFQGGGTEVVANTLREAVLKAATAALVRLYPDFGLADDTRWKRVVDRARDGSGDPLSALGFAGDVKDHPACTKVLSFVSGGGKRGSEVRKKFESPPYGWPREAVDGSLLALMATDLMSATVNGSPVTPKALDGSKIGGAEFKSQNVVLTTGQRIQIRKLFSTAGMSVKAGDELQAVPQFLHVMNQLAAAAGSEAPAPPAPSTTHLEDIRHLSGNEQLMALFNEQERLTQDKLDWHDAQEKIAVRLPRWQALMKLMRHASELAVGKALQPQVEAIKARRSLLAEPGPIPPLCNELTNALREVLQKTHGAYLAAYHKEMTALVNTDVWQRLPETEASYILQAHSLRHPQDLSVNTEAELIAALDKMPLSDLESRIAALPSRAQQALLDATKVLEPRAVRVQAPNATLKTVAEVEDYISVLKEEIMRHIEEGNPVVL